MSNTMIIDPIEDRLGISTYLLMNGRCYGSTCDENDNINSSTDGTNGAGTTSHGFTAISKARFSDFIVHEVGMDGTVACLTSVEPIITEPNVSSRNDTETAPQQSNSTTTATTTTTIDDTASKTPDAVVAEANSESLDPKKRKLDEMVEPDQQPDWMAIESELAQLLDNGTIAKEVIHFLHQSSSSSSLTDATSAADSNCSSNNKNQQYIVLPPLLEKECRKGVHSWVKERLSHIAAADTIDNGIIRIWHTKFRSNMPNKIDQYYNKNNKRRENDNHRNNNNNNNNIASAPRERPYLQFVLYKENMDTGLALQMISQRATSFGNNGRGGGGRGGSNNHQRSNQNSNKRIRLGYAGNKDKRGITCQFITVPARDTSIKHLCNVFNGNKSNHLHDSGGKQYGSGHTQNAGLSMIRIGNFQYVGDELRLGRLRGNRFDVALRNIRVDANHNITPTLHTKTEYKCVLTKAVQDLQRFGFINYFGVQRFGKYHNTHITGLAILRGDFQGAIDTIVCPPMLNDSSDDTISGPTTEKEGIDSAPSTSNKTIRDDAIRSAQLQWKNRFQNVLVHELSQQELANIEQNAAKQTLSVMNHYMQSEIAILQSLVRDPLNYEKAFTCIHKTMRMMFIHAVQSLLWNQCATYRIDTYGLQVVVGDLVLAPTTENIHEGCPEVSVVTESDVIEGRYKLEDIVLPLIGVKTRNPDNRVGTYMNTLLTEKYNIRVEMIEQMEKQRDFHCSGDYRKVICRPVNVQYELIEYIDELQPFIQTDFMKLNGITVPHQDRQYNDSLPSSLVTKAPDRIDAISTDRQSNHDTSNDQSERLIGMTISFTLPSSAYATICLRELMKRPTSSEYQRELQLGSRCSILPVDSSSNNNE